MAGTVYLRTNRYEVKLEGITFKTRDFETLCNMDFLFPKGKIWLHPPIVGLDVMPHPRDPTVNLVLLCFGVGCVILKFRTGEPLAQPILNFFCDERIRFVGYGIPQKKCLFPFEELGLTKTKVDIGFIAADSFNDPKFKRCELAELARKVLGTKKMVGLTEASSFERHEQIKSAICELFISTVIAMRLLGPESKKRLVDGPKKRSFLKTLNSLPLLHDGLFFKFSKGKRENNDNHNIKFSQAVISYNYPVQTMYKKVSAFDDDAVNVEDKERCLGHESCKVEEVCSTKKPLKGILKCPALGLEGCNVSPPKEQKSGGGPNLKRANSKGCNVSFK